MKKCIVFFFFKQKTAYEMRISDWSSDVCSSDLIVEIDDRALLDQRLPQMLEIHLGHAVPVPDAQRGGRPGALAHCHAGRHDANRAEAGAVSAKEGTPRYGEIGSVACGERSGCTV